MKYFLNKTQILHSISIFFLSLAFFVFPKNVFAVTTATVISTNMLPGTVLMDSIDSVTYTVSTLPAGTTATIQFSSDGTNWFNKDKSSGSETLTVGVGNSITLTNYRGTSFYYKLLLSSNNSLTPVVDDITISYTGPPNSITWDAWASVSGETDVLTMDSDSSNWTWDNTATYLPGQKTNESVLKIAGTGSLKQIVGQPQVDANTVGLWHLDETGGTSAYLKDASTSLKHGTPTGTTVVNGVSGKGRNFNGSSDYIDAGDSSAWDFGSGNFTLEAWVKRSSTGTNDMIIGKHNSVAGTAQFNLFFTTTNTIRFSYFTSGDGQIFLDTTATITDTGWHYIVANRSGNTLNIYIDGRLSIGGAGSGTHGAMQATATNLLIGKRHYSGSEDFFAGSIDEVKISNVARSAEEIAEAYRMGRDHYLSRTITSTNLSSKNSLPFYIAADRPGSYLTATIGESLFANYQPDANTLGLWHLDEQFGSASYIKDSSGLGNHLTPTGTTSIAGITGLGRYFNGTSSDVITCTDAACGGVSKLDLGSGSLSISAWVSTTKVPRQVIVYKGSSTGQYAYDLEFTNGGSPLFTLLNTADSPYIIASSSSRFNDGLWHHFVGTYDGTTAKLYVDGQISASSTTKTGTQVTDSTGNFFIGARSDLASLTWLGKIDEVRVDNTARSADQIRQAYEASLRSHPITIDFGAKLDSGNLITNVDDLHFTVDATYYGLAQKGSALYSGDKIVIKENYDGTEYLAQGDVYSVNLSTGAVTIESWDSGSTFPSAGFTVNAYVFKWQREYWNITEPLDTHLDATTNLNLRVTSESEGRTVYLDGFRSAGNYLTNPAGSTIPSSAGKQYLQYRALIHSLDESVTSTLTSVNISANGFKPEAPTNLSGTALSSTSLRWDFTDNSNNETSFKLFDGTGSVLVPSSATDVTSITETNLTPNTSYTRKVAANNSYGYSFLSSSVNKTTLANTPSATKITRTLSTAQLIIDRNINPDTTLFAIYKESGVSCDGSGGNYLAANGSDNGITAVWQTYSSWGGLTGITVSGLDVETVYSFCVKAKNSDNVETAFGPANKIDGVIVPISGDLNIETQTPTTFLTRYRDGSNPSRYVIGVDAIGTNSTNSAVISLIGGSVTINSDETLVAGKFILGGGTLFLSTSGSKMAVGAKLWAVDKDQDGLPDLTDGEIKMWYGDSIPVTSIPQASFRRKALLGTLVTSDCNDTGGNANNVSIPTTCYLDSDNDNFGKGTAFTCMNSANCDLATWGSTATGTAVQGNFTTDSSQDCNDSLTGHNYTLSSSYYPDSDVDTYTLGSSSSAGTAVCSSASNWNLSTSNSIPGVASVNSSFTIGTRNNSASATADCDDTTNTYRTRKVTGGTVTSSGGYKIHTFTSGTSSLVVSCPSSFNVDALVVAGGGGSGVYGACPSGGGGGGRVIQGTYAVTPQSYSVVTGAAGGAGVAGGASSLGALVSAAGGNPGLAGCSGATGGSSGAGFGGGTSTRVYETGGGGGAGGAGGNAAANAIGGTGGIGVSSSYSGASVGYGGGGGGYGQTTMGTATSGGGTGGVAGTTNRGGGAGGNPGTSPISGGSGVVIVRYLDP